MTSRPPTAAVSRATRRRWLGGVAGALWLTGCGKRLSAAGPAAQANAAPAVPAALQAQVQAFLKQNPLPARYRTQQPRLLQSAASRQIPSRLPDGQPLSWDTCGPTHLYVDAHTGWAWSRPGGDWIDARGDRHGALPWFTLLAAAVNGGDAVAGYTTDVTRLVAHAQTANRWLALLLTAPVAPRTVSGLVGSPHPPHSIDVRYADGSTETLRCKVVAGISPSSTLPDTASAQVRLPALLEFDRPRHAVASARLHLTVTGHWSGSRPVIDGWLLDPPVNTAAPKDGLAKQTGPLDSGLATHPEVIGTHRYTDDRSLADFVHADNVSLLSEHLYDPALFDNVRPDTTRLPHAGLGKWLNAGSRWELVRSDYRDEGFEPLAPGLGALRIHMPSTPGVADGALVGNDGTLAGHAMICLPEPLFGRLDRIFVRYYVRLGLPGDTRPRHRLQVRQQPGTSAWTNMSGKFGIGPDHSTSRGGVSGSSGGGSGWQMRLSWYECDAGVGGPDERGWAPGFHLYDFQDNNPPGFRYGRDQPIQFERWGQLGGTGGMLYAGHWYCIETELKLNTVTPVGRGFQPDGELRAWVDGRLVFDRTGMVFRSLPVAEPPRDPARMRPCRALGVRGLWMNWFHGGQTVNTVDRTLFYTGLAWAQQYIGPMAL